MRVIWTETAADELAEIVNYIADDSPESARRVAKTIFDGVMSLRVMPNRGRQRSLDTSRELVFPRLPYLALYEVVDDTVYVKAIRHTSRDWHSS